MTGNGSDVNRRNVIKIYKRGVDQKSQDCPRPERTDPIKEKKLCGNRLRIIQ